MARDPSDVSESAVTGRDVSGRDVSARWAAWRASVDLDEYTRRWERLRDAGHDVHGEVDLVTTLAPTTVLDAGCGTGRVAIELANRGVTVVGVDLDDDMLDVARRHGPGIRWVHADLARLDLGETFDVVVMAGNVPVFCRPEDRGALVASLAAHVSPSGALLAGFMLEPTPDGVRLADYDAWCDAAGLELVERWATWDRQPYDGGDYAVSLHRRRP